MKNNNILTPIKWTGCKRTQADRIISNFPDKIDSYYELFLGSGAVLLRLLNDYSEKIRKFPTPTIAASDTNPDLIAMWVLIKTDPEKLINFYEKEWTARNTYDGILQPNNNEEYMVNHRKEHYYALRDRYNKDYFSGSWENGCLLMTLLAFNFNGLVRYGKNGFNAACMPVGSGIHPDTKKKIIMNCHELVKKYDVVFMCRSYDQVRIHDGATVYLDPPYKMFLDENKSGVYNADEFSIPNFYEWCNKAKKWMSLYVSFDGGNVGDEGFPASNGWQKITNDTGTSKFRRQMTKTKEPKKSLKTSESLYMSKLHECN